jgi:hypothetical protein
MSSTLTMLFVWGEEVVRELTSTERFIYTCLPVSVVIGNDYRADDCSGEQWVPVCAEVCLRQV